MYHVESGSKKPMSKFTALWLFGKESVQSRKSHAMKFKLPIFTAVIVNCHAVKLFPDAGLSLAAIMATEF